MNFDELPLFRAQDTPTSRAGAAHVRLRLDSQQAQLLAVYAHPLAIDGITDEEAGERSGLADKPRFPSSLSRLLFCHTTPLTAPLSRSRARDSPSSTVLFGCSGLRLKRFKD